MFHIVAAMEISRRYENTILAISGKLNSMHDNCDNGKQIVIFKNLDGNYWLELNKTLQDSDKQIVVFNPNHMLKEDDCLFTLNTASKDHEKQIVLFSSDDTIKLSAINWQKKHAQAKQQVLAPAAVVPAKMKQPPLSLTGFVTVMGLSVASAQGFIDLPNSDVLTNDCSIM